MKVLKVFDNRLYNVSVSPLLLTAGDKRTSLMLIIAKAAGVHALIILLEGSTTLGHCTMHQRILHWM